MKVSEIETLPIKDEMTSAQRRLRRQAPGLIASIINDCHTLETIHSLDELRPEHIRAMGGGVDAATYLVNVPGERVIIKLGSEGIAAEAEAIDAWRSRHVRVPKIETTGVVPRTRGTKRPVRFLVQEALVDPRGRVIETCAEYLVREPRKARQIGQALGEQLAKIHSCVSDRAFGEFKDSSGSTSSYKNWNGYIGDATKRQADYLNQLGVPEEKLKLVLEKLASHQFVRRGRYLHGDFSIRNVAIKKYQPLKVSVFDPNPLIGDPSWDISVLVNNYEFEKQRLEYDDSQRDLYVRNQQLWIGFKKGYQRQIDEFALASARLVQAVYQAQHAQAIDDKLGFRARKEVIGSLVDEIIGF